MKRRIVIPEVLNVTSRTISGEELVEPYSLPDFVVNVLLGDRRLNISRETLRQADDIEDAFKDKKPGDVVDLPESLWKPLTAACEKPQFGQQGNLGFAPQVRQIRAYLDIICDAPVAPKDEPAPEPEKKEA